MPANLKKLYGLNYRFFSPINANLSLNFTIVRKRVLKKGISARFSKDEDNIPHKAIHRKKINRTLNAREKTGNKTGKLFEDLDMIEFLFLIKIFQNKRNKAQ